MRRFLPGLVVLPLLLASPRSTPAAPDVAIPLYGAYCFGPSCAYPIFYCWVLYPDGTYSEGGRSQDACYAGSQPMGTWRYQGGQLTMRADDRYVPSWTWHGQRNGSCVTGQFNWRPHDGVMDGSWTACVAAPP